MKVRILLTMFTAKIILLKLKAKVNWLIIKNNLSSREYVFSSVEKDFLPLNVHDYLSRILYDRENKDILSSSPWILMYYILDFANHLCSQGKEKGDPSKSSVASSIARHASTLLRMNISIVRSSFNLVTRNFFSSSITFRFVFIWSSSLSSSSPSTQPPPPFPSCVGLLL